MAELKTKLSDASVEVFLDGIADESKTPAIATPSWR